MELRVLHVLPFDSVRKRMSIVLQHPITKLKVLYCKGADSAILPLLAPTKDLGEMRTRITTWQPWYFDSH